MHSVTLPADHLRTTVDAESQPATPDLDQRKTPLRRLGGGAAGAQREHSGRERGVMAWAPTQILNMACDNLICLSCRVLFLSFHRRPLQLLCLLSAPGHHLIDTPESRLGFPLRSVRHSRQGGNDKGFHTRQHISESFFSFPSHQT